MLKRGSATLLRAALQHAHAAEQSLASQAAALHILAGKHSPLTEIRAWNRGLDTAASFASSTGDSAEVTCELSMASPQIQSHFYSCQI